MTNSLFDVPDGLRDFAERGVEQARKASEGFLAVAQRAAEAAGDAAHANPAVTLIGSRLLAYTEQNVNAALDLARKLVQAKDVQDAFAHQSEYVRSQLAALQTQATELGAALQKTVVRGSN